MDQIDIVGNAAGTFVTVDGGTGLDNITVNNDNLGVAGIQFNVPQTLSSLTLFTGTTAHVNPTGGTNLLQTRTLSIAGTGKLDLFDNDMILDYTGASQLAAIQALINQGRAGGAWSGTGISSSTAGSAVPKNTTLGALEATQYDSIYGAGATLVVSIPTTPPSWSNTPGTAIPTSTV